METKICTVSGCEKARNGADWCSMHRWRFKSEGLLGGSSCSESDCTKSAMTRGLCGTHYVRARRSGETGGSECSFVDCIKFAMRSGLCDSHASQRDRGIDLRATHGGGKWGQWTLNYKGYMHRRRTVNGKRETQLQHRILMEEWLGRPLLRNEEVHHRNGDRSDNRRENLELWNTRQPKGQRPEDKVEYALEILRLYAPEHLVE